jgi:hypothetical protein
MSFAVAINIALFGLIGPFAASVIDRFGPASRRALGDRPARALPVALTTQDAAPSGSWSLLWGVLVGTGTGVTSLVLAAIVANALVRRRARSGGRPALCGKRDRDS